MELEVAALLWISLLAWILMNFVSGKNGHDARYPVVFSAEGVLTTNLLTGYEKRGGKYGRPVANVNHAVPVQLMLQLIQIIDLDEKNQVLKLNLWTNYKWVDEFLQWNPDDYQGVQTIRIPSDKIWTPDIKLYNYADTRLQERRDALCIVRYDGNVTWIPQGIYMSTCDMDVTTFPFDEQVCSLKFGSWTYDGSKLDLNFLTENKMITDDYFVPNKAWTVFDAPAERNVKSYQCCPEVYHDLTYTLVFRRTASSYIYTLILPCVLLTSLTLVLFWIPPESPTKMSLGMAIYMAFFVLLRLFEANMPPASDGVPILGTYYCLNMILITSSISLNVFVANLSFYGARSQVPRTIRKVMFQYIARAMRMDNLVRPFLEVHKKLLIPPVIPGHGLANKTGNHCLKSWRGSHELLAKLNDQIQSNPHLIEIDRKLASIRDYLVYYTERIENRDEKDRVASEWKALGLIFDRLFFWTYLIIIMTSLTIVLSIIFTSN